jgi:dTDP-4-dehydrorhamnose reductase
MGAFFLVELEKGEGVGFIMKILITGANGFIASHLIASLSGNPEMEIIVTSRSTPRFVPDSVTPDMLDVANKQQVAYCMSKYAPQVVVHCAAMASVDACEGHKEEAWQINVEGTQWLLEETEKSGAHFVFLSSDFVFSGRDMSNAETDEPNPVNFYGLTKQHAEALIMQSTAEWTIVRPVLVYGASAPYMRENLFSMIYKKLQSGAGMHLVDDQIRTPTYVQDLVWALKQIIERRITGIYHVGGAEAISIYAFGLRLAHYFHFNSEDLRPVPSKSLAGAQLRPQRTVFENLKARRVLNYQPTQLETSFESLKERLTD